LQWELEFAEDETSAAVNEELLRLLSVGGDWATDYYL
jgi:hypothetical protein